MHSVQHFYDTQTNTLSYLVFDSHTLDGVLIDPVWNYDPAASKLSDGSVQEVIRFIHDKKIQLHFILETHAHADHISGSSLLKKAFPQLRLGIGKGICEVQRIFAKTYHLPRDFPTDGRQFDRLFEDGERIRAGSIEFKVVFTPGHTPACATYCFDNFIFVGDALFVPDSGVGRCDFPGGSAEQLFHSIQQRLYTLADDTQVFVGHDYQPQGRSLQFQSTIREEKQNNIHLKSTTSLKDFVEFRTKRDAGLAFPKLLYPSLQININAGELPLAEANGQMYLKIPLSL